MTVQSYKELTVWKKSIDLVDEIYALTNQLPKSEVYGLCSQMQRAAVAIPSNITEGYNWSSSNFFPLPMVRLENLKPS